MLGIAMVLGLLILAATLIWQLKHPDITRSFESALSGQAFSGANFMRFPFYGGGGGGFGGFYGRPPYGPADDYAGQGFRHADSYRSAGAGSYRASSQGRRSGSFRRADSFGSRYEDEEVGGLVSFGSGAYKPQDRPPAFGDRRFAAFNGRAMGRMNSRAASIDQGGAAFNERGRGTFADRGGGAFNRQGTINERGGPAFDRHGGAAFNRRGGATFVDRGAPAGLHGRVPAGLSDGARQRAYHRSISAIDRQQMAAQEAMRQGRFTQMDVGGF